MTAGAARRLRWGLVMAAAVAAAIQLVPVDRVNPPVVATVDAPAEVRAILERSCFDCHSRETRWPWYSRVAPVSWWVTGHVAEAREHVDFSDWPTDSGKLRHALHEIEEQVEKGEMPLWSYTLLHRDARLDDADRDRLVRWAHERPGP